MKPKDVTDIKYVEYSEETNKKALNLKQSEFQSIKIILVKVIHLIGDNVRSDNVRISKRQNIFAKGYTPNWSEEVFVVNKIQNTVPWTYLINNLNGEEIKGSFYEKELQKTDQKEFRIEKGIKKKGDKLYVKWKGYNNSFNSWIDKKDIV